MDQGDIAGDKEGTLVLVELAATPVVPRFCVAT